LNQSVTMKSGSVEEEYDEEGEEEEEEEEDDELNSQDINTSRGGESSSPKKPLSRDTRGVPNFRSNLNRNSSPSKFGQPPRPPAYGGASRNYG